MRKALWQLLLLAGLLLVVTACEPTTESGSKGIFYVVSGGENDVYLFGSVHVGDEEMYPLDDAVYTAFEKADILGLEINISAMTDMEITEQFTRYGLLPAGTTMTDIVGEETFTEVAEILGQMGIDPQLLDQLQPWYAAMLLTKIATEEAGLSAEYGLEQYFIEKADEREMDIISLETIADQLSPYNKLSSESQAIYLEDTFEELEEAEQQFDDLITHWQEGNTEAFAELRQETITEAATDSLREHQEAMLDGRDAQMAAEIESLLTENSGGETFFLVIGSLHLAGENSIVDQLRDMGYEVEAIN